MTAVVVVGRFGAAYGIKGWLNVASYTDPPDNLVSYRPWLVESNGAWNEVRIMQIRPHRAGFVVQVDGVADRDVAQRMVGRTIGIPQAVLPQTEEDEFYWKDLIGLDVIDDRGFSLGRVHELMETGANDVIVVRNDRGQILIPFLRHVVKDVDLAGGRMIVDWPVEKAAESGLEG